MLDDFEQTNPIPIIDQSLCNGCGLCVIACPHNALAMRNDKAIVADGSACEYAGLCEQICPAQVIERPFLIVMPSPNDVTPDA